MGDVAMKETACDATINAHSSKETKKTFRIARNRQKTIFAGNKNGAYSE